MVSHWVLKKRESENPRWYRHCRPGRSILNRRPEWQPERPKSVFSISQECMPSAPRSELEWAHLGSNQGPTGYEPVALPAELWARLLFNPKN